MTEKPDGVGLSIGGGALAGAVTAASGGLAVKAAQVSVAAALQSATGTALTATQAVIVDSAAGMAIGAHIGIATAWWEDAIDDFFAIVNDEEEFVPEENVGDDVPQGSVTLAPIVYQSWYYE